MKKQTNLHLEWHKCDKYHNSNTKISQSGVWPTISYHDTGVSFMVVWRVHTSKAFLSCSIPEICMQMNSVSGVNSYIITQYNNSFLIKLTNQDSLSTDSGAVFIESQGVCGELLRTTDTLH